MCRIETFLHLLEWRSWCGNLLGWPHWFGRAEYVVTSYIHCQNTTWIHSNPQSMDLSIKNSIYQQSLHENDIALGNGGYEW